MSVKVTFNNRFNNIMADKIIINNNDEIVFLSAIGYKGSINKLTEMLNKESRNSSFDYCANGHSHRVYASRENKSYETIIKKTNNSDLIHAIYYHKPKKINNDDAFKVYIYKNLENDNEEYLYDKVYEAINEYSSIPFLKEWVHPLVDEIINNSFTISFGLVGCVLSNITNKNNYYRYKSHQDEELMEVYELVIGDKSLKSLIQEKLREGTINIEGSNEKSLFLDTCNGLNAYLDLFGETLTDKIQNNFTPKFTPDKDNYDSYTNMIDDYIHYNAGIELFEAQKALAQATVNNWKKNSNTIVVGEMGVGKTLVASISTFAHNANIRHGLNAMIMCPSHLVEKWKREIERCIPNSKGYIIHNIGELKKIESKLRNRYRTENMFIILSKEVAKLTYENRPAAIWKTYKIINKGSKKIHNNIGHFICPECHKSLYREERDKYERRKINKLDLKQDDFLSKNNYNQKCPHCGTKLWTSLTKEEDHDWIKLGKEGWVMKKHINELIDIYVEKEKLSKKEKNLLNSLILQSESVNEDNEYIYIARGPRKYCVTKYIKQKMKGVFDYGIFDEMHLLAGKDSYQGESFLYGLQACKKNLAMTGTLINGYADSIYYILYRMFPHIMKANGFNYEDVTPFVEKYGVMSLEVTDNTNPNGRTSRRTIKKKLPGVSPLIFTDYLFNTTAFISLKDMKNELPPYTEIPIGVDMDEETTTGYAEYEVFMTNVINGQDEEDSERTKKQSRKILLPLLREMMNYPDAPHCARPIPDPDTEEVRFVPEKLNLDDRAKEIETVRLVEQHVSNGERILIYYSSVNKTDTGSHLVNLLNEQGYNAYELKASIKAEKRESVIKEHIDNGLDVLICNPSLVETGLDLIDFTTIIFYQVGYNLYTMRQASRRSWRLSQTNPVTVYYLYYNRTVQEKALSLMATKLHAAKTMEGDFDEEGLKAMSENTDILTQIANNVVDGMEYTVDTSLFASTNYMKEKSNIIREHKLTKEDIEIPIDNNGMRIFVNEWNKVDKNIQLNNIALNNPLNLFI